MAMRYDKLLELVEKRIWYCSDHAFAFLVDTPITLGHSQLVLGISKSAEEEDNFAKASIHATKCVKTFRTKLKNQSTKWGKLAKYTKTSGSYIKTLVLKVSADEEEDTYKMHLVPYFTSHHEATGELYRKRQKRKKGTGGLLNWLGEREWQVDCDIRDGRSDPIVKERIKSFNLQQLASFLCSGSPR
jgi:hypothetical protein